MNVKRDSMWKLRQAAWLFHHSGLDATALLFSDESMCAGGHGKLYGDWPTEHPGGWTRYLEHNWRDTQNLKASASISMTRDAEAVQLLLVGSAPNYRNALFDQLMQDQNTASFVEALNHNYGKVPIMLRSSYCTLYQNSEKDLT